MKYALLAHVNEETLARFKDEKAKAAARAAGMAYGEALRAAGVFVAGAGLEPPQTATVVSVRNGKRQVQDGPYAESKEFLAGSSSSTCQTWMRPWSGLRGIRLRRTFSSKCAR